MEQNQFVNKKLSDLEKRHRDLDVAEIKYETNVSTQKRIAERSSQNYHMTDTIISEKTLKMNKKGRKMIITAVCLKKNHMFKI